MKHEHESGECDCSERAAQVAAEMLGASRGNLEAVAMGLKLLAQDQSKKGSVANLLELCAMAGATMAAVGVVSALEEQLAELATAGTFNGQHYPTPKAQA